MTSGPDFTNPASIKTRSISWNADNMPSDIVHSGGATTVYKYDGMGGRIKKSVGSTDTYYIGDHFEIKGGTTVKYIFAGNLRVAQVKDGVKSYFHKDHLGSSTVMTDASGYEIETTEYMPFGSQRNHSGTDTSDYRFTDQELDAENGLYNYDARLYDPVIGRFISADPTVPYLYKPQSHNRYSYCRNNPLNLIDPTGLWDQEYHESWGKEYYDLDKDKPAWNPLYTRLHFMKKTEAREWVIQAASTGSEKEFNYAVHAFMDSYCPAHSSPRKHLWGWIKWLLTGMDPKNNPDNPEAPFNKKAAEELEKQKPFVKEQRQIMEENRNRKREEMLEAQRRQEEQRREEELKKIEEEKKNYDDAMKKLIENRLIPPL